MGDASSSADEAFLALVLFDDEKNVAWARSLPTEDRDDVIPKSVHMFVASCSIAQALFRKPNAAAVPEEKPETHLLLNRKRITTPSHNNAIVVLCLTPGEVVAGYPIGNGQWLGLFLRRAPVMWAKDISKLIARILLTIEVIPPLRMQLQERLAFFFDVLAVHFCQQEGESSQCVIETIVFLQRLGPPRTTVVTHPKPLSSLSSIPNDAPPYEKPLLAALRPAQSKARSRAPWWIVAACVLSNDGQVLKTEGIHETHATVLAWRFLDYKRNPAAAGSGIYERTGNLLLRSWYALGPLCLCVLSSQAEVAQTPAISEEELATLRKLALALLVDVKANIELTRS